MATLTLVPDFIFEEAIIHKTLVSTFETGVEQRRAKWASPKRHFVLRFINRTKADYEIMRDFVLARSGMYEAFSWVNRNDSVTYSVRFLDDNVRFEEGYYHKFNFEVTLVEV